MSVFLRVWSGQKKNFFFELYLWLPRGRGGRELSLHGWFRRERMKRKKKIKMRDEFSLWFLFYFYFFQSFFFSLFQYRKGEKSRIVVRERYQCVCVCERFLVEKEVREREGSILKGEVEVCVRTSTRGGADEIGWGWWDGKSLVGVGFRCY